LQPPPHFPIMLKHYRPAGKKKEGNAAKYITRTKAVKYLQVSLQDFRYPSFIDALRGLDDCLTMVDLFAALPAQTGEGIEVDRIHKCLRLSHEWQAYISRTHSLRKTYIGVKGIYYQANVKGRKITWLTPHALQQVLSDEVDLKVMLTFLEFYEVTSLWSLAHCFLFVL
ncbi:hypothetical protein IFM89_031749, partial [Coptis chinensis]